MRIKFVGARGVAFSAFFLLLLGCAKPPEESREEGGGLTAAAAPKFVDDCNFHGPCLASSDLYWRNKQGSGDFTLFFNRVPVGGRISHTFDIKNVGTQTAHLKPIRRGSFTQLRGTCLAVTTLVPGGVCRLTVVVDVPEPRGEFPRMAGATLEYASVPFSQLGFGGMAVTDFIRVEATPFKSTPTSQWPFEQSSLGWAQKPLFDTYTPIPGDPWLPKIGHMQLSENAIVGADNGQAVIVVNGITKRDVKLSAKVENSGSTRCTGLVARYSGPEDRNMYFASVCDDGAGADRYRASLYRDVGGTRKLLWWKILNSATGELTFEVKQSSETTTSLSVFFTPVNGAPVASPLIQDSAPSLQDEGLIGIRTMLKGGKIFSFKAEPASAE